MLGKWINFLLNMTSHEDKAMRKHDAAGDVTGRTDVGCRGRCKKEGSGKGSVIEMPRILK